MSLLPILPPSTVEAAADIFSEYFVFQQVFRFELAALAFLEALNHRLPCDFVLRLFVLRIFLDLSHHFGDVDFRTPALGFFGVKLVSKRVFFFFFLRLLGSVTVAECQILADGALARTREHL
mgnify:FL=1